MSEGFSDRDKHESVQESGDQEAYLDSLIEQFEDDAELELPDDTALPTDADFSAVDAETDEIIDPLEDQTADQVSEHVEANRDEAVAQNNSLNYLLVGALAAGLAAMLFWPASDHEEVKQQVSVLMQSSEAEKTGAVVASVDNAQKADQTDVMQPAKSLEQVILPEEIEAEPVLNSVAEEQPQMAVLEDVTEPSSPDRSTQETMQQLRIDPVTMTPSADSAVKAWAVNLTSVTRLALAEEIQQQLSDRGTNTELIQVTIGEKNYYRIRMAGFASRGEAEQARLPFLNEPRFAAAWVALYHEDRSASE